MLTFMAPGMSFSVENLWLFHYFASNIDCEYLLELPQWAKIRKILYTLVNYFSPYKVAFSRVFITPTYSCDEFILMRIREFYPSYFKSREREVTGIDRVIDLFLPKKNM